MTVGVDAPRIRVNSSPAGQSRKSSGTPKPRPPSSASGRPNTDASQGAVGAGGGRRGAHASAVSARMRLGRAAIGLRIIVTVRSGMLGARAEAGGLARGGLSSGARSAVDMLTSLRLEDIGPFARAELALRAFAAGGRISRMLTTGEGTPILANARHRNPVAITPSLPQARPLAPTRARPRGHEGRAWT